MQLSRRRFLKAMGAAGLTAGLSTGLFPFRASGQGTLSILLWSHFVPKHDEWFDNEYAPAWGQAHGVNVTVDHISIGEIPAATAAEISAGQGHDIIEQYSPPSNLEPSLLDLADVNQEAESKFGPQLSLCRRASFNPTTGKFFGFCHGWVIDPGDYRQSLWAAAGKPQGPETWQDLLTFGSRIRDEQGVQVGIGLSQEIDTNMATRACLWSFDTGVQDENSNVILNNPKTVEAVKLYADIFQKAMTPEVFAWSAASNNQALIAGRASFILNSISAYRSAQQDVPEIAKDIFFVPALKGPNGTGWASEHVIYNYVVPQHVPSAQVDLAKQFMLDYEANYDQVMWNSKVYNSPAFFGTAVPAGDRGYEAVAGAQTLQDLFNTWFDRDPFAIEGEDPTKLQPLKNALEWSTVVGHPGPANPAVSEVFATFVLPNMFARVARGDQSAEDSVKQAHDEAEAIFKKWRDKGLI